LKYVPVPDDLAVIVETKDVDSLAIRSKYSTSRHGHSRDVYWTR
jgi:hypothetical protein